jgi:catechol 2,3-dioxygenase-like lactoylglutathione lyase family enzyme
MSISNPLSSRKATLTAPVSRLLAVTDAERSIAFYRDTLGFDVHPTSGDAGVSVVAELTSGAARIQLSQRADPFDSTGERRPRGAAILFFETDDVRSLREEIRGREGVTNELENVNWLKMRMFKIRDPDGHSLWFGQSFHQPDQPRPRPMLEQIMPNLPLSELPRESRTIAMSWASQSTMPRRISA